MANYSNILRAAAGNFSLFFFCAARVRSPFSIKTKEVFAGAIFQCGERSLLEADFNYVFTLPSLLEGTLGKEEEEKNWR